VCGQCTRSCGGGIHFRSVTCVGGRACVSTEKPTEDQGCNTRSCSSADEAVPSSSSMSTVAAERPSDDISGTPARTSANSTAPRDDVTLSNHVQLFTTSSSVTIATTKMSSVVRSSATIPQTTTETTSSHAAAATASTAATVTSQATTIPRIPLASYRWMALFWDQVLFRLPPLQSIVFITENSMYMYQSSCHYNYSRRQKSRE